MKFDWTNWEKNKKRTLFYLWPMGIATTLQVFVVPLIDTSSNLALLTPFVAWLVFVPFAIVDWRRQKAETAREKRELQAKHDAQDRAMFGKPLREIEL